MYATNSSSTSTNIASINDNTDIAPPAAALISAKTNIRLMNPNTTICPAVMLAKSRIANTKGLVKQPTSSMIGINGIGNFKNHGTPGVLKMSSKYSLLPKIFVMKNVNNANTNVIAMLPVRLAPNGKNGQKEVKRNKIC